MPLETYRMQYTKLNHNKILAFALALQTQFKKTLDFASQVSYNQISRKAWYTIT